jgi:hypothetical protein
MSAMTTDREAVLKQWELERGRLEQSRPQFNHVPHAVAAVFTGGLWVIGWIGWYWDHERRAKAYEKRLRDFYDRYRAVLQSAS